MSDLIDGSRAIREGEELDLERLAAYLKDQIDEIEADATVAVEQFPSGHSNLTYLLKAGEREYVLRRPPFGSKVKSAHDMGREYRVLSKLHAAWGKAPEPLVFCEDPDVLGADFYVMRRLRGIILRRSMPKGLVLPPERVRSLDEALFDNLAELHSLDYREIGLGDLGKPDGYVERQVTGWTKRYRGSQTDEIASVDEIAKWLADHLPAESQASLIHNDYKFDNVVLDSDDPRKIIGVLDWEMSTVGDPLMDLGTALSYWVEAEDHPTMSALQSGPTTEPGSMTRQELAARYAEASGRDVGNPLFYYAFGLFKTAVVIQQIYYRYHQGLTQDERFAGIVMGVHVLCNQAQRAVEAGHI